jgi:hypothetical protein
MTKRYQIILFWALMAAGLVMHILFWIHKTGMHYPDEIFQYIEPAFVRIRGFGWLPWEFNRGVRNWSLIAFYGGWMKIFITLGFEGAWLHKLIGLHNTILALAIVPAAWRLGRLYGGERAGWMAAALSALFPPIVYFTPHPLSEVPSMVLGVWGLTLWLEGRGKDNEARLAFLAGMLLGFSVVVRFFAGMLLIVPFFDYLVRAFWRRKGILYFILGGLVPLAVLGLSDWITWGKPFHSAIEYFRYNILEWGNVDHGVSPWWQYFAWTMDRLNWGLILFVPFFILGLWRTRLLFATAALALLTLSLIAHKEERFMMGLLPLFIVTFAAGADLVLKRLKARELVRAGAAAALCAGLIAAGGLGASRLEWHWLGGYFEAQDYVGRQPDVTGCMFKGRLHLSGGSVYINRNIPMDSYQIGLSRNPLFNYFIFPDDSSEARVARTRAWDELAVFDGLAVFRKPQSARPEPKFPAIKTPVLVPKHPPPKPSP